MSTAFQEAFAQLLRRAPAPLFPRARALYLRKYALEDAPAAPGLIRTFLLEEEILEVPQGLLRVSARAFAVVHWQGPQLPQEAYAAYLQERWLIRPTALTPVDDESWFRDGGAFARFTAPAVYERALDQPVS
jgi:hypothetical protein